MASHIERRKFLAALEQGEQDVAAKASAAAIAAHKAKIDPQILEQARAQLGVTASRAHAANGAVRRLSLGRENQPLECSRTRP